MIAAVAERNGMLVSEYRYQNALKWLRSLAGLHYMGGAFDPEHMRDLANIAADALAGRNLADWEDAMEGAQERARKWAGEMSGLLRPDDEDDGGRTAAP
jgi:hypothetical protein